MSILNIIQQLRDTGSTLQKQAILESHKHNDLLKMVFMMTENPSINYYMRVDPALVKSNPINPTPLDVNMLATILTNLHDRILTGNAAKEYIYDIISTLSEDDAKVLTMIINRDLDCKTGTSIINKVWAGTIPEMPCMLASKMDEKAAKTITQKKNGYIVQLKCDGGRAMAVVNKKGAVEFLSRNGKPLLMHGVFDALFEQFPGYVFDGELLVKTDDGVADRKTGNGFFTKAVRGTIQPKEAVKFHYVVWDIIPVADFFAGKCKTPYKERLTQLINASDKFTPGRISIVPGKVISSLEEANSFYADMLAQGEEGAILKFMDSPWEDKRSKFMIKLKEEKDIDAEVIGTVPHSKKPDWIGALRCRTRDGKVEFEVGSGFTEEDRKKPASFYFGKVVQCKYNMLIEARGRDTYSLFLPVFQCVRFDKTEANSLEELK
jgi:DNA ligase 1